MRYNYSEGECVCLYFLVFKRVKYFLPDFFILGIYLIDLKEIYKRDPVLVFVYFIVFAFAVYRSFHFLNIKDLKRQKGNIK